MNTSTIAVPALAATAAHLEDAHSSSYTALDIAKAIIHMHGLKTDWKPLVEDRGPEAGVDVGWDVVEILRDGPSCVQVDNGERDHWQIYSNIEGNDGNMTVQQAVSAGDALLTAARLIVDLEKASI